jgi:hypothetical protein
MQDQSYWRSPTGHRLSRRRLLAAGTAAAALSGISAVGCMPSMGGGEQSLEEMMRADSTKKARTGGVFATTARGRTCPVTRTARAAS